MALAFSRFTWSPPNVPGKLWARSARLAHCSCANGPVVSISLIALAFKESVYLEPTQSANLANEVPNLALPSNSREKDWFDDIRLINDYRRIRAAAAR